jgi:hypothetical protein
MHLLIIDIRKWKWKLEFYCTTAQGRVICMVEIVLYMYQSMENEKWKDEDDKMMRDSNINFHMKH